MKRRIKISFIRVVIIIEFALLIGTFIVTILADPKTLNFAVYRATKNMNITYDDISGNLLKTMVVTNIRYKGEILASEAIIDWNMRALAKAKVEIEELELRKVNLATLITLTEDMNRNRVPKKKKIFIPTINIQHLFFSTLPYHEIEIEIDKLEIEATNISANSNKLEIESFLVDTLNDHSNIMADGNIKDKILQFDHLWIQDIDIEKILDFNITQFQKQDINKTMQTEKKSSVNNLLSQINIRDLKADIKPFEYKEYKIKAALLSVKNSNFDLKQKQINSKKLSLHTNTNLGNLAIEGRVKDNNLLAQTHLNLNQRYFSKYTSFVDFGALNPLKIDLTLNKKAIDANLSCSAFNILRGKKDRFMDYKVSINSLLSQINFDFKTKIFKATTDANISTPHSLSMIATNNLIFDKKLSHEGDIRVSKLENLPKILYPLFKEANIHYKGRGKSLDANLKTTKLKLNFNTKDFKTSTFKAQTKKMKLIEILPNIPEALHNISFQATAKMPLIFKKAKPLYIPFEIESNFVNFDGKIEINRGINIIAKAKQSKNSILKEFDKNIKMEKLFPSNLKININKNILDINILNNYIQSNLNYDKNSSFTEIEVDISGEKIKISGEKDDLHITTKINSLKIAQEKIKEFYKLKKIPLDGEIKIDAKLKNLEHLYANIKSRWLVYEYTTDKFAFAEKIDIATTITKKETVIHNYQFDSYLDYNRNFFSSKPSIINYNKERIVVNKFWINDGIKTYGNYNLKNKTALFHTKTDNYHYKGEEGNIKFSANITTKYSKENTKLKGTLTLLDGIINYEPKKTHNIKDPDIIIIQEEKERKQQIEDKKNNLSIDIQVNSKKPIIYKIQKVEVSLEPDLTIWKNRQNPLGLLGRIIINQGVYRDNKKDFIIEPGEIMFGGDILTPYLNIKALHKSDPYEITIEISGTLDSPIINFRSDPYLSQSDILSIILFGTTSAELFTGKTQNSSNQAISMFGNTFAKEIVENFGIKLDRLVLLTNQEGGIGIEVGKKISNKITLLYINDIVSTIKVKYQNSKHFETDLTIGEESSGIEFFFKTEY